MQVADMVFIYLCFNIILAKYVFMFFFLEPSLLTSTTAELCKTYLGKNNLALAAENIPII